MDRPDASPDALREQALRLLERRAFSRRELAERLLGRGHERGAVEDLLGRLAAAGLLDDEAYAGELARRVLRGGPASVELLVDRMTARGVGEAVAARAARDALGGESRSDAAMRLARQAISSRRGGRPITAAAIAARLVRRGFDPDTIHDTLQRLDLADLAGPAGEEPA